MPYILRNETVTATQKAIQKFSKEIPIKNNHVEGTIVIEKYRKYSYYEEIDITFKGKICAKMNHFISEWFDSNILKPTNEGRTKASKIKVNRFIRKSIFNTLTTQLNYFDITLRHYSEIKKIKWE